MCHRITSLIKAATVLRLTVLRLTVLCLTVLCLTGGRPQDSHAAEPFPRWIG